MHPAIVASIAVNTLLMLVAPIVYPELHPVMSLALGTAVVIETLGAALVVKGTPRCGAYLVLAGSLPFVPLGWIGAWGARRVLDESAEAEFWRLDRRTRAGRT